MKKRYAVGLALVLAGVLSGCGQTKAPAETQAEDNTISIAPVEQTDADKSGKLIEYDFSGHKTDANGVEFSCYTWNGSEWKKDDGGVSGLYAQELGSSEGTIKFERDGDAENADYIIEVDSPEFGGSTQTADAPERTSLPEEGLKASVAVQENAIDDLAVGTEIPLLVRVFSTDGTAASVSLDAFSDPENSEAVKNSAYAEVYTVTFCHQEV